MADLPRPRLTLASAGEVRWLTDAELLERSGVLVAFSERTGGVSAGPYASLDLAAHTGDDPAAVDENRSVLVDSLGLGPLRDRLVTAEQVHGDAVVNVLGGMAGSGAWARGPERVPACDALMTAETDLPLMLLCADCVPVVLVAESPRTAVCVVHAGWRGALAGIAGKAAAALAEEAGCDASALLAYVGPHICARHYEVGPEVALPFAERFVTIASTSGGLDLRAAVLESLSETGVDLERVAVADLCTAEMTGRFYSYRAEGRTGRHAALATILR